MRKAKLIGRQYTRRQQWIHRTEWGAVYLEQLTPPRVSTDNLETLKLQALDAITGAGIPAEHDSQADDYGSTLKDAVLNRHDKDGDSIEGLAARIYFLACHAQGYQALQATPQAMDAMAELGRLVTLWDVYRQISTERSKAGKSSVVQRSHTPLADEIKSHAAKLAERGVEQKDIAGMVARHLEVSPQHVRRVLKKREP